MVEMRISSRAASRIARYSIWLRMRGALISYLGWEMEAAGFWATIPSSSKKRKKVLMALSLRETDLAVYFWLASSFLNSSICSV